MCRMRWPSWSAIKRWTRWASIPARFTRRGRVGVASLHAALPISPRQEAWPHLSPGAERRQSRAGFESEGRDLGKTRRGAEERQSVLAASRPALACRARQARCAECAGRVGQRSNGGRAGHQSRRDSRAVDASASRRYTPLFRSLRDKKHGRIYRLVPKDGKVAPVLNLKDATSEKLVAALKNDNLFWRRHAQRLLAAL